MPVSSQVAGLQRRHHLAAVVAQRAGLVEVGAEAGAHEAAVAAQLRRLVDQRAGEQSLPGRRRTAPGAARCRRSASGRPMPPAPSRSRRAQAAAAAQAVAHGAEVARAAALQGEARHGARDVGRGPQRGARILAQRLVLEQEADRVEPRGDRIGSRSGLASRAASSRAPGPVTVRSMAASRLDLPLARERAQQLQARPRRRIDHEAVGGPAPARRTQAGLLADLRQLDVLEQCADGCQLGPRERTEAARSATCSCALSRRSPARLSKEAAATGVAAAPAISIHLREIGVGQQRVGGDHLAGRQAHDLAGKVGGRHLAHLELAGRDVERGQRDRRASPPPSGRSNTAVR